MNMKISTKGRYALRLMVDLAEHQGDGYVALKDTAQRQGISKKYLEQIVPMLNHAECLSANRGAQGGYRLARTPDKYTVGEILRITEGDLTPVSCAEAGTVGCERSAECDCRWIWQGLYEVINDYLEKITLQDVLDRRLENAGSDYVI